MISEKCYPNPLNNLISLDGDYLVRIGMRYFGDDVPVEQNNIVSGIKEKYGVRDGSCAGAILEYLKDGISLSIDPCPEYKFYRFVYDATKRWSRSTVRKKLRRLEELGILERMNFIDLNEEQTALVIELRNFFKEKGGFDPLKERIVVMKIYLPDSILRPPQPGDELLISGIKTIREGEKLNLEESEGIIDKIDLRNLSDEEKRRLVVDFTQQPFLGIMPRKNYHYTHEQRIEIIKQVAEEAMKLPNILSVYSVGSVPNNEDRKNSDVDILVVREHCPGYDNCGARLTKADAVDLFCFTEEEYNKAREKKLAILIGATKLYDKPSLRQNAYCFLNELLNQSLPKRVTNG